MTNIVKISAEKVYMPVANYYLKASAFVELDDYSEKTVVYVTDGAEKNLCVFDGYIDDTEKANPEEKFDGCNGVDGTVYEEVLAVLKKAVDLIDNA